jgi:hypothetical protein
LRGFASVNGVYDSGLTTISPQGVVTATGASGVELLWGGYGVKSQKRSAFGLDYQGDYRRYNTVQGWNGLSQNLTMTYSSQPFRRISFDLSGLAGSTNRSFGVATGALDNGNVGLANLLAPTNSLFDLRTNFFGGTGQMTWIISNRLSSSVSASGFTVRRRSRLPGADGFIGRADVAYRLGRYQTIGADISYYKFDYTNAFGDVNILDPGILLSQQLGRRWSLMFRGGVMRVESFGTRVVNFEPEIAALLGVGQTSEIFYLRTYQPSGQIRLMRTFKRGAVSGTYRIMPNPGNGLLYASRQNTTDVSGGWSINRRMNFNINAGHTKMASVTSLAGRFEQYNFGGGLTYKLSRTLELLSRVDRRVARLETGTGIGLNGTRLTVGLAFSPSDVPLQLW